MTGAQARAVVPVEVLVEENVVAPVRVGLECLRAPVDRTLAAGITQEDAGQALRDLPGDLEEVHQRA